MQFAVSMLMVTVDTDVYLTGINCFQVSTLMPVCVCMLPPCIGRYCDTVTATLIGTLHISQYCGEWQK